MGLKDPLGAEAHVYDQDGFRSGCDMQTAPSVDRLEDIHKLSFW